VLWGFFVKQFWMPACVNEFITTF